MARRKKGGGGSPSDFQQKITALEALFGQKEAAKRLGVSTSTLRNYKTGKSSPPRDKEKKLNRVYGQNKKKISEEKLETYQKKVQKKKETRRKQLLKNPKLISTQKFVEENFEEDYIQRNILADTPPFVAPIGSRGQFTDGFSPFGIPKGTRMVTIMGIYTNEYDPDDLEKGDYVSSRFPILLRREMNIEEALDYLEGKFFETTKNEGKRRLNPSKFIGYQL
jgi:transcriptional regulator with XRE-family HTH domain